MKVRSFGFITDPLDHFDREAETTLFLMREIQRRGHAIFICEPKDLFLKQNELWGYAKQIELTNHRRCFYRILAQGPLHLKSLDALFLRKDPPFDMAYLHHLYLLMKLKEEVWMINDPEAILKFNEKLSALDFPFAPRTLVSSRKDIILSWAKQFKKGVVLKPLHCGGGVGVRWIKRINYRTIVPSYHRTILCQEYLPEVKNGDKRILLWDGKVLGAFLRKPKAGEFRANLHQGGRFVKTLLTSHDKKIASKVGGWAKKQGLCFVGLDVIGNHLTEINVTSPMGIREINALYGEKVERKILNSILEKI